MNDNLEATPVHIAAYLLWRINWIHPFWDGNGRTARAVAYAMLCIRLGFDLPGTRTIPEQIAEDKSRYYKALEAADEAYKHRLIDVSMPETLLDDALAEQLVAVHRKATGKKPKKIRKRK